MSVRVVGINKHNEAGSWSSYADLKEAMEILAHYIEEGVIPLACGPVEEVPLIYDGVDLEDFMRYAVNYKPEWLLEGARSIELYNHWADAWGGYETFPIPPELLSKKKKKGEIPPECDHAYFQENKLMVKLPSPDKAWAAVVDLCKGV